MTGHLRFVLLWGETLSIVNNLLRGKLYSTNDENYCEEHLAKLKISVINKKKIVA